MSQTDLFWYTAGTLTALALGLLAWPLLRGRSWASAGRMPVLLWSGAAALPVVASLAFYAWTGSPALVASADGFASAPHAAASRSGAADPAAGSMEQVLQGLEQRLREGRGQEADWRLLSQTYQFLGRTADADAALRHELPAAGTSATSATSGTAAPVATAPAAAASGGPAEGLLAQARAKRQARDHAAANVLYQRALELDPSQADGWADYADSLGAANRSLQGAPEAAIGKALALQPGHNKALWLKASLQLERKDYASALRTWQQLRGALPAGSPDQAIIDANIEEARQLAGSPALRMTGQVELAPALAAQWKPGMTLFVFARPTAGGAPYAVHRQVVERWPAAFRLDDSMAMMPGHNLSSATQVRLEARLSSSGRAEAAAGDLQAEARVLPARTAEGLRLVLSTRKAGA